MWPGLPLVRVKLSGFMKNRNASGPVKNTTVSPRIRVFHTLPWRAVRVVMNANGSLRNGSASPRNGRPRSPGGTGMGAQSRSSARGDDELQVARVRERGDRREVDRQAAALEDLELG